MSIAAHRFNNDLRYRTNDHPNQRQLTPPYVLVPVREAMGGIDLDPCTEPDNPTGARRFFTATDDGLAREWSGSVYCNPPYGKAREPWVQRCIAHARTGNRVVLLIPSHTDTRVVQSCFATATTALFIKGRVKFETLRENRRREAASHPSALFGWNVDLRPCAELGHPVVLNLGDILADAADHAGDDGEGR